MENEVENVAPSGILKIKNLSKFQKNEENYDHKGTFTNYVT